MELQEYVETRRRRYLAKALTPFDEQVQPVLNRILDEFDASSEERSELELCLENFKRELRRSFRNFTNDVTEYLIDVKSPHINVLASELRDRVR